MLFGGNSGSCGGCGCKSCQQCTRTCTNPHTGAAFETVYTLYSGLVGAEIGNPTDGYLTATGDSDTDDPQDGMDGTGPWYQQVSGSFELTTTTTRHPCEVRVSFWRNNYTLGPLTPGAPSPSEALTLNRIRVSSDAITSTGDVYVFGPSGEIARLAPGQSCDFTSGIPKVSGTGDQSTNDPGAFTGTMSFQAVCGNSKINVTVTARLEWNVKQRQHVLYGLVRECYLTTTCTCATGTFNTSLYLEISGFTDAYGLGINPSDVNGTYVLKPVDCYTWYGQGLWVYSPNGTTGFWNMRGFGQYTTTFLGTGYLRYYTTADGVPFTNNTGVSYKCGTGTMGTATASITFVGSLANVIDVPAGDVTLRAFA